MACLSLLNAVGATGLQGAELQAGYTVAANATQGGPDVVGLFSTAVDEANQLVAKLKIIVANISSAMTSASASSASTQYSSAWNVMLSINSAYTVMSA